MDEARRVVCFHYFYPPLGGIAARRAAGLARHLGAHGWEPVVITPAGGHYYGDPGERDPGEPPGVRAAGVTVLRTRTVELSRLARVVGRKLPGADAGEDEMEPLRLGIAGQRLRRLVRDALYVPDAQVGWLPFAVRAGVRAVRERRAAALYSSSFPISAHLAALLVSRRTGTPWIAEFRDLWTRHHMHPRAPGLRRRVDEAIERRIVTGADRVLTVTETWRRELAAQFPELPAARFRVLPNGYEPEEFAAAGGGEAAASGGAAAAPADRERFRLVYVGTMYGERQDPGPLFDALAALVHKGVIERERLRLEIVGRPDARARELAAARAVGDLVEFTGFVSHGEAVARQVTAGMLLVILDPGDARLRGCIPGKVFEYLAAQRPILGIVPAHGETAALLLAAGGARIVDAHASAIEGALAEAVAAWRSGGAPAGPKREVVERYRYDRLAGELAVMLDGVSGDAGWSER